jgi:predicted enzyme related to lactoylglutathione lyase
LPLKPLRSPDQNDNLSENRSNPKILIMNRTVYVTAIGCLTIGAVTGGLVTRLWLRESKEDSTKVVHDRITPTKKFAKESTSPSSQMEKVTGIGGFFFRVKNSGALNEWYEQYLGVRKVGEKDEDGSWWQDEGPTVFASESAADQAGGPEYEWRINFRVRDLDAMVAQLRAAGVAVEVDGTIYPNGRFAHLRDPEGNRIELWEPAGADLVRPADPQ